MSLGSQTILQTISLLGAYECVACTIVLNTRVITHVPARGGKWGPGLTRRWTQRDTPSSPPSATRRLVSLTPPTRTRTTLITTTTIITLLTRKRTPVTTTTTTPRITRRLPPAQVGTTLIASTPQCFFYLHVLLMHSIMSLSTSSNQSSIIIFDKLHYL